MSTGELLGKPNKLRGVTCNGLASRPGGVEILLAPVVQRVDNAIQRISIGKTNYAIRWIVLSTL